MKVMRLITILFGLSIIIVPNAFSQDLGSTILREQDMSAGGIQTGHVVAFGKPISPPYFVTTKNNKIMINELQFLPRPPRPAALQKSIVVSNKTVKKHELIQSVLKLYTNSSNDAEIGQAKAAIRGKLDSNPLVKNHSFNDGSLIVNFKDGTSEEIFLDTPAREPGFEQTENMPAKIAEDQCAELKKYLEEGAMIVFGHDYTLIIPSRLAEEEYSSIKNVLSENESEEGKRQVLNDKFKKEAFTEDVLKEQGSW